MLASWPSATLLVVAPISTESYLELEEVDLVTRERRCLLDGDEPFDASQPQIARIVIPGQVDTAALGAGFHLDSEIRLLLPAADVDGEDVFAVTLRFYGGSRVLVLLTAPEPLPHDVVHFIVEEVALSLCEADFEPYRHLDLAFEVKNLGIWMLRARTRSIEQSVRDALADDELTSSDYVALRSYPARLARIERLAARVRDWEPAFRSFKPPDPSILVQPVTLDSFYKYVNQAADDARDAVARLSGLLSSQQIVLAQRQAAATERFQRIVTLVGAAVLVPGLVAAGFGANVDFPGQGSRQAFWAMLALMASAGIASYAVIRSFETEVWTRLRGRRPIVWITRLSETTRLVILLALAVMALGIGLALMAGA